MLLSQNQLITLYVKYFNLYLIKERLHMEKHIVIHE